MTQLSLESPVLLVMGVSMVAGALFTASAALLLPGLRRRQLALLAGATLLSPVLVALFANWASPVA